MSKQKEPSTLKCFRLAFRDEHIYINPEMVRYYVPHPDGTTDIHYKDITFRVGVHSGIIAEYLKPVPM
jgi:hypothetical protein